MRFVSPFSSSRPFVALLALLAVNTGLFWLNVATFGAAQDGLRSSDLYDVIVAGSEPEGVAAAVAAAEAGARTLLVSQDPKVGGLFVLGQMNSLDLRTSPFNFQQGFFERWWRTVGRGHAFDVARAEAAFQAFLNDAGVTVRLGAKGLEPVTEGGAVVGVRAGGEVFYAPQVVDATAEMDLAAAAGAGYSVGFASLGLEARMADTLVFRIDGVDWRALQQGIRARGKAYASVDERVAWGHFGGYPAAYEAAEEGIRLRGLNLGLQDDGSLLVNALLIYGIDPFDPASVAAGRARAEREAPRIVDYLKAELPGFARARFGGVAPELYVRESRHLRAECTLTVDDVLDNRVDERAVAAGGYPLDVQTLTPFDNGYVYGAPEIYGVPLCVTVPKGLNGLWVVGKAAGFDPIAASSARVVPLGMAVGEAVGVAAARAARLGLGPAELAADAEQLRAVRQQLLGRGAYLPPVQARPPVGPYLHPAYRAYRLLLSRGLAVGGYDNDPKLDEPVSALSYVYLLSNVGQRFFADPALGQALVARFAGATTPLSPELALDITHSAACGLGTCPGVGWSALEAAGLVPPGFAPSQQLTRGEMYLLAAAVAGLEQDTSLARRGP